MSASLTFTQEIVKAVVSGVTPVLVLILGGRQFLDWYDLRKKRKENNLDKELKIREQELELSKFVRQKQYEAVQELYAIFANYMSFYRLINSNHIDLSLPDERLKLLKELAPLEGRLDAVILRIASEFASISTKDELAKYLPDLRQACQLWRESVRAGKTLPFDSSDQNDYVLFKDSFTKAASYLANRIYDSLDRPQISSNQATKLLMDIFENKHGRRSS